MPDRRQIGLWSAVALVAANMIGVGVFTTSGFALADLGRRDLVLLAWAIGGVIALSGAVCYGALATRFPDSGGEYLFLSRTIHPLAGFLAGWISLLAGFTAPIAAAGLGLQAYIAPSLGLEGRPEWIGTIALLLAGCMHGIKLQGGLLLQNLAVAIKLGLLAGFVLFGAIVLEGSAIETPVDSPEFEISAFAVTLVWISFAYSGWNAVVYIAGEIKNPEANLRRSLFLGTITVTVLYVALNAVFVYSSPIEALAGHAEIGAIAAEALGGEVLRRGVIAVVALALFTSISSMVMVGPRVYAKMAEDNLFPRLFSSTAEVPTAAIAFQIGLALVVLWVSSLAKLLSYIGFTLSLSTLVTVAALVVLRLKEGPERIRIPGYPYVPSFFLLATATTSLLLAIREPLHAGLGLITALTGVPAYFLVQRFYRTELPEKTLSSRTPGRRSD